MHAQLMNRSLPFQKFTKAKVEQKNGAKDNCDMLPFSGCAYLLINESLIEFNLQKSCPSKFLDYIHILTPLLDNIHG